MGKIKSRVGEKHITNEGYEIEIVEYINCLNVTVVFLNGYCVKNTYSCIKLGNIANPYHPTLCNIGYIGEGKYKSRYGGNSKTRLYNRWSNMIRRCYDENDKNKTYKDVIVCEKWHNFQNFAQWFEENWKPWMDSSWDIDKDIVCKDSKIYSPETCVFVPKEINNSFKEYNIKNKKYVTGVTYHKRDKLFSITFTKYGFKGYFKTEDEAFLKYKLLKEKYIKELADKWKNKIDIKVYKAMYAWII